MMKTFGDTAIPYDDGLYVTYVNAEIDDGSGIAELMNYFKTANPEDMSQGALSARVHFLKCEEGGFQEVCVVSEKIYQEGLEEGQMQKARESALNMKKEGLSEGMIARILKVGPELVQQWLAEVSVQIERNIPKINQ